MQFNQGQFSSFIPLALSPSLSLVSVIPFSVGNLSTNLSSGLQGLQLSGMHKRFTSELENSLIKFKSRLCIIYAS